MMFVQRVPPSELIDLLAAESYDPVLMQHCNHTRNAPRLAEFLTDKPRLGVTGTIANAYVSADTDGAIPYLTTKQVSGLYAHLDGCKYITKEADQEWTHCRVPDGAIVLNKSGNVGAAAIVSCAPFSYVSTVSDLINIRPRPAGSASPGKPIDGGYLVVFLNSPYGQSQLQRLSGGAVFDHVSLYAIPDVRVFEPSVLAQRYIGDKVRQSERLRVQAKTLEERVAELHAKYVVPPSGIDLGKRTRRLPSRDLTERLDAHFYPAAVEQYLEQVGGTPQSIQSLSTLVSNGQTQPEAETGVLQATVTNLGRSFVEGQLRTVERPNGEQRTLAAHDLLLCNAAHNKSYIGRDVTYCQLDGGLCASTEVMVIRVNRGLVPASFLRHYLKSDIGYLQIQATIRGITAHSYPGDVKLVKVPVPNVPPDARAAWFATDDQMLRAGIRVDTAELLIAAAAQLVELLVEGRLSDGELAAAQKGLESGDRTHDRSLLQTLRRKDRADSLALFPDVDALYALLDDEEAEEGGD